LAKVTPDATKIDLGYLHRWLTSVDAKRYLIGVASKTAQPALSLGKIKGLPLPLPPLAEQRRIAKVLDRAEALRAKRHAALAQLDSFTQCLFLDSFVANNKFPSESLDCICELITDGTHYTPTYSETGVIFLSSRNVTSGYITWDDVKFIPESLHTELHRRVAPKMNDILLAKNGTTGIAAIVDRDCVFDIYVSLALIRPSVRVLPIFLRQAINSPACTRQFNASLKGIGVPNLHLKEIRKTTIPVPPIELQREFARRVGAVEKLKTAQRASLTELDALFATLQHRAFRGEL
jgi:type I restriction enzyme S subunit